MNLPDFLVIGAQRSATSWLYFCLKEHPDVFVPYKKEIEFFSRFYQNGIEWYARYFELRKQETAAGEVTPSYLADEASPERIRRHLPGVKLVAVLRNPVERAYSQYLKQVKAGAVSGSFQEASGKNPAFIKRGMYHAQLSRYWELFGREKICIVFYEDIKRDPVIVTRKIYEFLGVDPAFEPSCLRAVVPPESLQSGAVDPVSRLSSFLRKRLKAGPLIDAVKRTPVRKWVDVFLHALSPRPTVQKSRSEVSLGELDPELVAKLQDLFSRDVSDLSQALGRDLNALWSIPRQ